MMSRKHYKAIAEAIACEVERNGGEQNDTLVSLMSVAGSLAKVMSEDNPRFDRNKFLVACKVA